MKILGYRLNPQEKFRRYRHFLWLFVLMAVVCYVKLDFLTATLITILQGVAAYIAYQDLKKKAGN